MCTGLCADLSLLLKRLPNAILSFHPESFENWNIYFVIQNNSIIFALMKNKQ